MDELEKFSSLRARQRCSYSESDIESLSVVESKLSVDLPRELRSLLSTYQCSIIFDSMVWFRPKQLTGLEDVDGSLDLEMIYGLVKGCSGLLEQNGSYSDQVPSNCIVVGASSGGDQICLDRHSSAILFWHHEAQTDEESLFVIADSFLEFVGLLFSKDDGDISEPNSDIVESGTFLNF